MSENMVHLIVHCMASGVRYLTKSKLVAIVGVDCVEEVIQSSINLFFQNFSNFDLSGVETGL